MAIFGIYAKFLGCFYTFLKSPHVWHHESHDDVVAKKIPPAKSFNFSSLAMGGKKEGCKSGNSWSPGKSDGQVLRGDQNSVG